MLCYDITEIQILMIQQQRNPITIIFFKVYIDSSITKLGGTRNFRSAEAG